MTEYPTATDVADPNRPTIKVHEHGHVALVDKMGDDAAIVQAARVSYGKGTKTRQTDRGLIRYCMRKRHTSIFEQVEFKFHIKLPIFVMRQLIRHRTACLAGDTKLVFKSSKGAYRTCTMKDFYHKFHGLNQQKNGEKKKKTYIGRINPEKIYSPKTLSKKVKRSEMTIRSMINSGRLKADKLEKTDPNWDPTKPSVFIKGQYWIDWAEKNFYRPVNPNQEAYKSWTIRSLDEEEFKFYDTKVTDIWESGVKKVYRITLENGTVLTGLSKDHLCYTDKGWQKLKNFVDLKSGEATAKLCAAIPKGLSPWDEHSYPIDIDLKKEKFKWIPGFEGDYKISNYGRVKSYKWGRKTIKVAKNSGRPVVSLQTKKGGQVVRLVSRLVAETWIGKAPKNKNLVRHINGNWLDNRPRNLAWGSFLDNSRDMISHNNSTHMRPTFFSIVEATYTGKEMTYDMEVEGPFHNFVADGVVVHNSVNEYSGRYSEMRDEFYYPDLDYIQKQSVTNKQGRETNDDHLENRQHKMLAQSLIISQSEASYSSYRALLGDNENDYKIEGVARELARIILPLNIYTECYWKIDLHNLLHFLDLRYDSHAQAEIVDYAKAMAELIKPLVPLAFEAWEDYFHKAYTMSRMEMNVLRHLIQAKQVTQDQIRWVCEAQEMTQREIGDFFSSLEIPE